MCILFWIKALLFVTFCADLITIFSAYNAICYNVQHRWVDQGNLQLRGHNIRHNGVVPWKPETRRC